MLSSSTPKASCTPTMTIIEYENGNCHVGLDLTDGTKVRTCEGDPRPEFPDSIDLKITERCDLGCPFCHEASTPDGSHASPSDIRHIASGLPVGAEIAVGGGNPLAYPSLEAVLQDFRSVGLVANLTAHLTHAMRSVDDIAHFRALHLVWGLGLSGVGAGVWLIQQSQPTLIDNNTVLHYVAGVDSCNAVRNLREDHKVLILGYKMRGRGAAAYTDATARNIGAWRYFMRAILRKPNLLVSFDNLAIVQLEVESLVSPDVWNRHYMGDDGEFTMFVDAVQMEYAASSLDEKRLPLGSMTVAEAFATLHDR